jgi:hypothetical protein
MSNEIYSEKLKLNYKVKKDSDDNRVIVFEDGVNYRNHELLKIKHITDDIILQKIHSLKKIFNGVIEK